MKPTLEEMIETQVKRRGIVDQHVISAMREVDRVAFVPENLAARAYEDGPLPIGQEQTISQPYIVAYMAQALKLDRGDTVLEIGTGCGYNAAILSRIVSKVYSIEVIEWLADLAQKNLTHAGIDGVSVRVGDGYKGWPEKAPFDAIALTAATPEIPEPLKQQLKTGGRLIAPVGEASQNLVLLEKTGPGTFEQKVLLPVRFVPMTGQAQKEE